MTNPRAWFVGIPILIGLAIVGGAVAWLLAVRTTAGTAGGPEVTFVLDGACANAALAARLQDYGLPATFDGPRLRVRLGSADDDPAAFAAALVRPGRLDVAADGRPLPVEIVNAGVQISLLGEPVTLLTLREALPNATITVRIDGEQAEVGSANGVELQVEAVAATPRDALRLASDRVVALRHPLPCAVAAR